MSCHVGINNGGLICLIFSMKYSSAFTFITLLAYLRLLSFPITTLQL